ncbi:hypothetical protein LVB87_13485 [Lysobacter sp. KIS68-7]|uniref:hypothetical protein n=1 Tax=Lysobacter sp. KIS68-7 TaxID=2904252 RepID=UPI001E6219EE|nr:hypothetical protein [Lysobacter sp. KIS68-7]UHQ19184.1 hypothetical protein LVB87_13485 [Lysobacter sp. KIS68-7]
MKRLPPLSEGAKLRALYQALQWRARALLPVGSEKGYSTDAERAECQELAAVLERESGRRGTADDGRVLWVVDVMVATGMGRMAACRWVLAAIDAQDAEPNAAQIDAINRRRVETLSANVRKHLESTTTLRSQLLGRTEDPNP